MLKDHPAVKYLKALFQSFYKPELYREAITSWKGIGGAYLILLAAVLAIILAIGFYVSIVPFERDDLPFIAKQVPAITIDNGTVSVTAKQPVTIANQNKTFIMTIDTSKAASDLRDGKNQLAIGKDFIMVRDQNNGYQVIDLTKIKGKLLIDESHIYKFINMFKIMAFPLLWFGQILNLFVKLIVVTVLSYVVTAFMREEYDFAVRMRISILALTPPVLIALVLSLGFDHDVAPWFFMLLSSLYIYVMIVLMRRLPPVENTSIFSTTV
jgi:hypothetical protein